MLIGNKADLTAERAVKKEEGVQVAKVSNEVTLNKEWVNRSSIVVVRCKRLFVLLIGAATIGTGGDWSANF